MPKICLKFPIVDALEARICFQHALDCTLQLCKRNFKAKVLHFDARHTRQRTFAYAEKRGSR